MTVPKKQKAQIITEFGINVKYEEIDVPHPEPDEVLVHIFYSGVCHTDVCFMENGLHTFQMKLPMVAGHEGAGEVVAMGENVKTFKIGDKVGIKVSFRKTM